MQRVAQSHDLTSQQVLQNYNTIIFKNKTNVILISIILIIICLNNSLFIVVKIEQDLGVGRRGCSVAL